MRIRMTHNPSRAGWSWRAHALAIVAAVMVLGGLGWWVAAQAGWRATLVAATRLLDWRAVAVVLPLQALAIFTCAVALWLLRPGPGLPACFASRITRDAGNNVLLILPGLGEAVGARMLVLAGGSARAALVVRGLDVLAETLGQLPYIVIALIILAHMWGRLGLPVVALPGWEWGALGVALMVALAAGWRWLWHAEARFARRLRIEARLLAREARRRRGRLPAAIALHVLAWGLSGVQIWFGARVMGLPLGLAGAIAMESAASALRVLLFFVPGGFVTQEAGVIGAGLAFGLPPSASLALALVLRARDAVFALALGWWPWAEWRHRREWGRH